MEISVSTAPPTSTTPIQSTNKPRLLRRLRFSLLTLLLTVLLIGSVTTLVVHWQPWYRTMHIDTPNGGEAHETFAFAPDSSRFVTIACGYNPRVRNAQTGALEAIHPSCFKSEFSPDGKRLLIGEPEENRVQIWDVTTHAIALTLPVQQMPWSGFFSRQGLTYLYYGPSTVSPFASPEPTEKPSDSGFRVFSETGVKKFEIGFKPGFSCTQPCISADGKMIVGIQDHGWSAWDAQTGAVLPISGKLSNPKESIYSIHVSPDGQYVLTNGYVENGKNPPTRLWRIKPGEPITAVDDKPGEGGLISTSPCTADFRPDGNILIFNGTGFSILDIASRQSVCDISVGDDADVLDHCQSPDGNTIVVADGRSFIEIWRRRRPEGRLGLACLPEFWTTLAILGAIGWTFFSKFFRVNESAKA